MKKIFFIGLFIILIIFKTYALDEIKLHSGQVINGTIVEQTDEYTKIDHESVPLIYYKDEIESISTYTQNQNGTISASYSASYSENKKPSPEQEKQLNAFKDTLEKNLRENLPKTAESLQNSCKAFPEKLAKCEPYTCELIEPFTGLPIKQEIIGIKNNACVYVQHLPNNGTMSCNLPSDSLAKLAQYSKEEAAKTTKGSFSISTSDPNPWQEYINNGDCVISGYE